MGFMKKRRRVHIFLLPCGITLLAIYCGFMAIIEAYNHQFIHGVYLIYLSIILDSLDGRVARLTHSSSHFGAELDSLADVVSFAIAPAVTLYNWGLYKYYRFGIIISFFYCACVILRLARFNTTNKSKITNYFIGLPCPAGAAIISGYVLFCVEYAHTTMLSNIIGIFIAILVAFSLVSNMHFYSFKKLHFYQEAKFTTLVFILPILILLIIYPEILIYAVFALYLIITYIITIWKLVFKVNKKKSLLVVSDR